MSRYAEYILSWATQNHLRLNVDKTKAILIGSYFYINEFSKMGITGIRLSHSTIKLETTVRSLGVWLDSKLDWKEHITHVCKKANTLLYRLNYFRKSTNFMLRKHLVETLLFPLIDNCCLVYCDISGELDLKLQRVINSGTRYVCGVRKSDHISAHRRSLGWLTTLNRRNYFAVCLLHKLFFTTNPPYLFSRYEWNNLTRPVRGDMKPLTIPRYTSSFLEKSFFISSSKLWNNVPSVIRRCNTTTAFKSSILNHYHLLESEHSPLLQSRL